MIAISRIDINDFVLTCIFLSMYLELGVCVGGIKQKNLKTNNYNNKKIQHILY